MTFTTSLGGHWDLSFPWREDPHQMDGPRGHSLQEVHHRQWCVELRYRHVGGGFIRREALLGHEQPGCESFLYHPTYELPQRQKSELIPETLCIFKGKCQIKILDHLHNYYIMNSRNERFRCRVWITLAGNMSSHTTPQANLNKPQI